jgi:hypothetical protein
MFRQKKAILREQLCSFLSVSELFRADGIVLPKHVGTILKRKIKKYGIQCILLVILYTFENARLRIKEKALLSFGRILQR